MHATRSLGVKILALVLLPTACSVFGQNPAPSGAKADPFTATLRLAGLSPADLGFRPRAYWARYPNMAEIPYKPLLFEDLFAEPVRLYDVVRIMALAAEDYLDPRYQSSHAGPLYKLAYFVGFEKKVPGFRNYGHTQTARIAEKDPLVEAVRAAYVRRGRTFDYRVMGKPADWPRLEDRVRRAAAPLHPDIRKALARAVLELTEARRWVDTALRRVDPADVLKVWRIRDLSETQFDAMDYYPEVDDVAAALDEQSLYYAGMRTLQAAEGLKRDLEAVLKTAGDLDREAQHLDLETPLGRLVLGGGGSDTHRCRDVFLLVDLGGNDTYHGPAGATSSPGVPVSVCLDLAGNDRYLNEDRYMPAQGAAVFGAGVCIDVEGDDEYRSRYLSQGAGQFGTGILADLAGNDVYAMDVAGQGSGVFGVGLLMDGGGRDAYRLGGGDGQGYGGVGGVGTLVDVSGNDSYFAEPDATKVKRADYHAQGAINYAYAQGVGIGRRGDLSDGHSWAGGIGTLIDLEGDDRYESGNWSLGCSYWYGIGFFYDRKGNDEYRSCAWSLASGAHFGISAFFDEAGDDRYLGFRNASQNLAFGHDYVIALFVDRSGDDVYEVKQSSLGYAQRMSQAWFLDLGGNDTYRFQKARSCLGATDAFRRLARPRLEFTYEIYAKQIGVFLDTAGSDAYIRTGKKPGPRFRNRAVWMRPEEGDARGRHRHYGIGRDLEPAGAPSIPWLAERFGSLHQKDKK